MRVKHRNTKTGQDGQGAADKVVYLGNELPRKSPRVNALRNYPSAYLESRSAISFSVDPILVERGTCPKMRKVRASWAIIPASILCRRASVSLACAEHCSSVTLDPLRVMRWRLDRGHLSYLWPPYSLEGGMESVSRSCNDLRELESYIVERHRSFLIRLGWAQAPHRTKLGA